MGFYKYLILLMVIINETVILISIWISIDHYGC